MRSPAQVNNDMLIAFSLDARSTLVSDLLRINRESLSKISSMRDFTSKIERFRGRSEAVELGLLFEV
jgi:hypothetical protein